MDYGRRSDRYDSSPPHRASRANRALGARDGSWSYRDDYDELQSPLPSKDGYYHYDDYEERRRRPSYSVEAPRGRRSSSSSKSENYHRRHSHHHYHQEKKKKTTSSGKDHHRPNTNMNWKQAVEAAAGAAAAEAWRSRGNPDRMKRVATAAAGAAAVDVALGRGEHDDKNKRHAMESAIGGLVIDRMVNGPSSSSKR